MAVQPEEQKSFYETHVFCCVNQRPAGHPRSCCADRGGKDLQGFMKSRAKELGIKNIRVNQSGCLERCELGATMVIYPEGVWYTYDSQEDVEEILTKHIIGGEKVDRLVLEVDQKLPRPKTRTALKLRVARIENLTAEIKLFELVAPDGAVLPPFEAGAHVDVVTGGGHRRSYSLANDPAERNRYVIGVLREKAGRGGSAWMHDNVKLGDSLTVMPPLNNFPLAEAAAEHVLIGGGIGITPMKAMVHSLTARSLKYTLHYCSRAADSTAFRDELEALCGDNIVFHHDGGDPSKGIKFAQVLGGHRPGSHVYVCGPTGFLNAARAAASHWPEDSVHFEVFAPSNAKKEYKNEPFTISLARRKQKLTVPADKSILEVVREAGVVAESSCEEGICSTCKTRLIAGKADHRDEVLTSEEKAGQIMICVSRAQPGETLILDL